MNKWCSQEPLTVRVHLAPCFVRAAVCYSHQKLPIVFLTPISFHTAIQQFQLLLGVSQPEWNKKRPTEHNTQLSVPYHCTRFEASLTGI